MTPLAVVCWRWGGLFGPEYVERLRAGLERHLAIPHQLVCVTDDPHGIDSRVRVRPMPTTYAHTPRCRRRMETYSRAFARELDASRILLIDLDVVIVGDLTPIVDRPEPLVCWKVGYAGVFSGSFVLFDGGHLDAMWREFEADPEGTPRRASSERVPSDQAMLNAYLRRRQRAVPCWTEADGFVTYFGKGYEAIEHLGVGPQHRKLPPGARIVVLGSADKAAMDEGRYSWIREHWSAP